jgi:hypothetical protein
MALTFSVPSPTLYRAVKTVSPEDHGLTHAWRPSMRLPVNVPYVVDNLWEWLRPASMPCRRHAVYASPSPELALENAARHPNRAAHTAYLVDISGEFLVAQLPQKDAREHPDIRRIQQLAQDRQPAWAAMSWEARQRVAMLFAPGCTKADFGRVIEEDDAMASFVKEATVLSTFWADARGDIGHGDGELFFELQHPATYRLRPLAEA